jgi:hypothetical protein
LYLQQQEEQSKRNAETTNHEQKIGFKAKGFYQRKTAYFCTQE